MSKSLTVKNKLPGLFKYFLLLFPFVIALFQWHSLDNDFYFLYPTGEYILNNGFPHTDILSMHTGMNIVVQQWLSSVIFYLVYSKLGKIGLFALIYLVYAGICYFTYRLNILITKNELVSLVLAAISNILIYKPFIVTRPQTFTFLVLLIEIYILEKYVQTKKISYLIGIPVLSLLLINLHASMWPMLFVFMLPFIAGAIPVKIKNVIELKAEGNILHLLGALAIGAAMGFINPYGMSNVFYLLSSYGDNQLADTILEMLPSDIGSTSGKILFGVIILMGLIGFFYKKSSITVRHLCLLLGTLLLALLHRKGVLYFYIYGISAFSCVLKDLEIEIPSKIRSKITGRVQTLLFVMLVIFTVGLCGINLKKSIDFMPASMAHYDRLDEVSEILNKSSEPVVLYTNFGDGQYMEYKGFRPYIDGRAELFLQQNNGEFDYYGEYYQLRTAHMYYRDFTDKYQFNYLLVNGSSDRYLLMSLLYDEDFELAYEKGEVYLFARK